MSSPNSQPPIDIGVQPGDVLAGKYRVAQVLGVGGMGVVVAAHHIQLDEKVALKFLLPSALKNAEAVARFEREARAAVKIKSEHVARVSDVGKLESGSPYMVMEYLEGSDLSVMLEKRGSLPIQEAVEFVLQACEALAEAHVIGIVHRDLKPANLYCIRRADGRLSIKVLDFGISKLTSPGGDASMTRTTAIMGSPLYMSPEQMQSSKRVDARSDIWALGVILFELVTGNRPFDAEAVTELVIKIATEQPADMASMRADLPPGFEDLVRCCLEKDPERRFRNVGELALALEPFGPPRVRSSIERILGTMEAAGTPASASRMGGGSLTQTGGAQSTGRGTTGAWGATGGATPRNNTILGASIGGGLFLVLVVAGVLMMHKGPAPDTHATAAQPDSVPQAPPSLPASSPPPVAQVALAPLPESPPVATVAPAPVTAAPNSAPSPVTATHANARPVTSAPAAHVAPAAPEASHPAADAPHPVGKANCTPPYYYDANGTRIFKKECL